MSEADLRAAALVRSKDAAERDAMIDAEAQRLVAAKVQQELAVFHDNEKATFIEHLEEHGNVHKACLATGVSRRTAITARQRDPLFADAWHQALEGHVDDIEEAMVTRAKDPSSACTVAGIFMLKARRRDQYGEQIQATGEQHKVHVVVELSRRQDREIVDAEVTSLGEPDDL